MKKLFLALGLITFISMTSCTCDATNKEKTKDDVKATTEKTTDEKCGANKCEANKCEANKCGDHTESETH